MYLGGHHHAYINDFCRAESKVEGRATLSTIIYLAKKVSLINGVFGTTSLQNTHHPPRF